MRVPPCACGQYGDPLKNGLKKNAKQWEIRRRLEKQTRLKELIDTWMLQRFKTIIADQMPTKHDNIVICALAPEQSEVYDRILQSPDYQQLMHGSMNDVCRVCDSGEKLKDCHRLDMDGVLARYAHPDGDECARCPSCILFPALVQLSKVANHLELLKPDESMRPEIKAKQADFARMALGISAGGAVERDRRFSTQSHASGCGKMQVRGLWIVII